MRKQTKILLGVLVAVAVVGVGVLTSSGMLGQGVMMETKLKITDSYFQYGFNPSYPTFTVITKNGYSTMKMDIYNSDKQLVKNVCSSVSNGLFKASCTWDVTSGGSGFPALEMSDQYQFQVTLVGLDSRSKVVKSDWFLVEQIIN